jgi:secreted trypsin-like serine protease
LDFLLIYFCLNLDQATKKININFSIFCSGDSGGGLITDIDNEIYLIGLVSFGGTCKQGLPDVFTKVSSYLDWIEEVMTKKSF